MAIIQNFLTRTAEMVRTLGTMHEYVQRQTDEDEDEKQYLQIEATKWVPALLNVLTVVSIDELLIALREEQSTSLFELFLLLNCYHWLNSHLLRLRNTFI